MSLPVASSAKITLENHLEGFFEGSQRYPVRRISRIGEGIGPFIPQSAFISTVRDVHRGNISLTLHANEVERLFVEDNNIRNGTKTFVNDYAEKKKTLFPHLLELDVSSNKLGRGTGSPSALSIGMIPILDHATNLMVLNLATNALTLSSLAVIFINLGDGTNTNYELPNLKNLDLSFNFLSNVPIDLSSIAPNLAILDVSHNEIKDLKVLCSTLYSLRGTISSLSLSNNAMKDYHSLVIHIMSNALEYLDGNKISRDDRAKAEQAQMMELIDDGDERKNLYKERQVTFCDKRSSDLKGIKRPCSRKTRTSRNPPENVTVTLEQNKYQAFDVTTLSNIESKVDFLTKLSETQVNHTLLRHIEQVKNTERSKHSTIVNKTNTERDISGAACNTKDASTDVENLADLTQAVDSKHATSQTNEEMNTYDFLRENEPKEAWFCAKGTVAVAVIIAFYRTKKIWNKSQSNLLLIRAMNRWRNDQCESKQNKKLQVQHEERKMNEEKCNRLEDKASKIHHELGEYRRSTQNYSDRNKLLTTRLREKENQAKLIEDEHILQLQKLNATIDEEKLHGESRLKDTVTKYDETIDKYVTDMTNQRKEYRILEKKLQCMQEKANNDKDSKREIKEKAKVSHLKAKHAIQNLNKNFQISMNDLKASNSKVNIKVQLSLSIVAMLIF